VTAPDDVPLVGFAELSATVVRARLLAAHDRFWDVDTRPLHHPVWFDQFGGFGVLARSADGEDVGYLLGVVTADRLAYLHLLAVRDDRRRTGLGRRLVRAFDDLALGTERGVQGDRGGVLRPGDRLHDARPGAGAHLVQDRAGPGEHRLVLTRSLAR
jgi:GNAT superfamily N-acetyltransferase